MFLGDHDAFDIFPCEPTTLMVNYKHHKYSKIK